MKLFGLPIIGQPKWEVDTPALLLDIAAVELNIAQMAAWFVDKPCKLRPHVKTHKLPLVARMQLEAGAIGITCAKLSEAQVFLEHGFQDILIANEIVGQTKIRRLIGLVRYGHIMVCVDHARNAEELSQAAEKADLQLDVLVEVNVGLNRCGVAPGPPTLELAQRIQGLAGLRFRGVMGYEGGLYVKDPEEKQAKCLQANQTLVATRDLLINAGIPVEIVSAGGSNTYNLTGAYPGITDVQVGSYVTMDLHNEDYGLGFRQALSLLTTVISRPEPDRAVIDAGLKAISQDAGLPGCRRSGISVTRLNEEHGHLRIEDPDDALKPGDKVELIPSHGCTTIPLHDVYVLVRGSRIESVLPIGARGALF
jgi:D-serine deaminase-like pyridoxal phosphate-dependent protein